MIRTMRRHSGMKVSRRKASNPPYLLLVAGILYCVLSLPCATSFPQPESVGWLQTTARSSRNVGGYYHNNNHHCRQVPSFSPLSFCPQKVHVQQISLTLLEMSRDRSTSSSSTDDDNNDDDKKNKNKNNNEKKRPGKKELRKQYGNSNSSGRGFSNRGSNATTALLELGRKGSSTATDSSGGISSDREQQMLKRLTQLESLVAKQTVEIRRLQDECRNLEDVAATFANVVELLRAAGLDTDKIPPKKTLSTPQEAMAAKREEKETAQSNKKNADKTKHDNDIDIDDSDDDDDDEDTEDELEKEYEYFEETEIFGEAPASVIDAADAAGAAILAGLLGGKQRMLVDVRDSELSRDPETLVQFIELAILPVAAGLEGLKSNRNRVKIVFPTVSQLLEYRRTMALAAPEVVALSTLGFDPVEDRDNLVVIVAPAPDNEEGLKAMNELLEPPEWAKKSQIRQPIVVLNHHMIPLEGPAANYDVMYHLRLLSVQYMSGDRADEIFKNVDGLDAEGDDEPTSTNNSAANSNKEKPDDAVLEAAMKHAQEAGVNHGLTRAMVIRAYPKPWHVFVDVSPATDADFVVAATFDNAPRIEEINMSIVECLEGSEREDEIVAQQMQQALDMENGNILNHDNTNSDNEKENGDNEDDDDEYDDFYDLWNEDSI